ncbi:phage portal protein [Mycobacterium intracellulare]|uniref:phage portal protein n=1 Tax=Mycobacterium intracellulare TaxID=1767 RepID=UPI001CDB30C7|nr:phage portal protein [Mycobacterium intracellulare]MCA2255828.1 phage portal protein [Mycobacterium intracellulare]
MSSPLLIEMQQRLTAGLHRRTENRAYWDGRQPLAYLAPEAVAALGNRFGVLSVNYARVAITALTERIRLNGFDGVPVWDKLFSLDYDTLSDTLHREALLQGESFCLVWADEQGNPTITIESGETMAVKRDDVTRQIVAAIKQVTVKESPATKGYTDVWLYTADAVEHWRSNTPNGGGEYDLVERQPNALGTVPVVSFVNADLLPSAWRGLPYLEYAGESEIQPIKPLIDAMAKTVADMLVAQEFTARPRRWATGIEPTMQPVLDDDGHPVIDENGDPVTEAVNPIPESNRAMLASSEHARFGQLEGASLQGFKTSVDILVQAIMTVSALPAHMCGITTANPSTSEAMQSAEAGLTSRAESKAKLFAKSHEQVARLVYAIANGVDPASVSVRALWGPFDVRSEAAAADAATKLYSSGLLSRRGMLERLGLPQDQVEAELTSIQRDAEYARDIKMGRLMSDMRDH